MYWSPKQMPKLAGAKYLDHICQCLLPKIDKAAKNYIDFHQEQLTEKVGINICG